MALNDFGQAYKDMLRDLTSNDLNTIKFLRDLAVENDSEAPQVVEALRQHIKTVSMWSVSRTPASWFVQRSAGCTFEARAASILCYPAYV